MNKMLNGIMLLPIYALFLCTWLMAAIGKLLGPGVPDYFTKMFAETFLASFPGLTVAFYQIAAFETVTSLLFLASLLRGEFLPGRTKTLLRWGLWMSLTNFAMLGFGMRLVQNHDEAGKLFYYFCSVVIVWLFVEFVDERPAKT